MEILKQADTKERKYNEKAQRNEVINRFMLIGTTILYILYLVTVIEAFILKSINQVTGIIIITTCCLALVINWSVYIKKSKSDILGWGSLISYMIVYSFFLLFAGNTFVRISALPVLCAAILFYDNFLSKIFNIWCGIVNILYTVEVVVLLQNHSKENYFELIIILLALNTIYKCTEIGGRFSHDSLYAVKDQQEVQNAMLQDILDIAKIVQTKTSKSNELVHNLGESAGVINTAISEISSTTQTNANNLQEQNMMTQTIQKSIQNTVDRSEEMVTIASDSTHVIQNGMEIMQHLKDHSENITQTNHQVVDSMDKLQDKTKEVREIADIIFNISSQTNLLALNASIESARAGEAEKDSLLLQMRFVNYRNKQENQRKILLKSSGN